MSDIVPLTSIIRNYSTFKPCTRCQIRPTAYPKSSNRWCKVCLKQNRTARYDVNRKRDINYRRNYQEFSLQKYNSMFREQEGKCAVCQLPETTIDARTKLIKNLSVDHDHRTGRVRGLLCTGCNSALGMLREDPSRMRALIQYVNQIACYDPDPSLAQLPLFCEEASYLYNKKGTKCERAILTT